MPQNNTCKKLPQHSAQLYSASREKSCELLQPDNSISYMLNFKQLTVAITLFFRSQAVTYGF